VNSNVEKNVNTCTPNNDLLLQQGEKVLHQL